MFQAVSKYNWVLVTALGKTCKFNNPCISKIAWCIQEPSRTPSIKIFLMTFKLLTYPSLISATDNEYHSFMCE